jgi:hypothetical protein
MRAAVIGEVPHKQPAGAVCGGKRCWGSYRAAMTHVNWWRETHCKQLRSYKCRHCGYWHTSSLFKNRKRK